MEYYKNLSLSDLPNEVWVMVEGYSYYMVSNYGRIKCLSRPMRRGSFGGVAYSKEKIKAQRLSHNGYLQTDLYTDNGDRPTVYVHIVTAESFIPNPENKLEVNHKKGIKTDNRVSELEWNTPKENTQHGIRLGLIDSNGEKCGTSKLTNDKVIEIRRLYKKPDKHWGKPTKPYYKIAEEYNVTSVAIRKILFRQSWKHI